MPSEAGADVPRARIPSFGAVHGPDASTAPAACPDEVRRRLGLAFDVDDLVVAERLARQVRPWFGVAKVGLELYSAAGPDAVGLLADLGYEVFVDLKLHDIPTTVRRAARVLGVLGARYVNFHAAGGAAMLRAGVEGLAEGAHRAGAPEPTALAVTVLTSETEVPPELMRQLVEEAVAGKCGGVVCAASDVATVRDIAPQLLTVVPGIRLPGGDVHDQGRAATPSEAIAGGADLLVVGRAVTAAEDPSVAAADVVAEALAALG